MAIRDEFGLSKKRLDIGVWDMDASATVNVAHGLSGTEWQSIRRVQATIRNDGDLVYQNLESGTSTFTPDPMGMITNRDSTNIVLVRVTGGVFDSAAHSTAPGGNRGWVDFEYIAD
jgi:hypothetical protein